MPLAHAIVHRIARTDAARRMLDERTWAGARFRAEVVQRTDGDVASDAPGAFTDLVKRPASGGAA